MLSSPQGPPIFSAQTVLYALFEALCTVICCSNQVRLEDGVGKVGLAGEIRMRMARVLSVIPSVVGRFGLARAKE